MAAWAAVALMGRELNPFRFGAEELGTS